MEMMICQRRNSSDNQASKKQSNVVKLHEKKDLDSFISHSYHSNTSSFMRGLAKLVCAPDGVSLTQEDIMHFFNHCKARTKKKVLLHCLQSYYNAQYPVEPLQSLFMSENFTGERLRSELRKALPGLFPSDKMERVTKKQLEASFNACLLPRRSALGWHVDPERLLQILTFRYPFLQTPIHIKITGDGREYGGRQSTFVALTVLNNELLLQNVSYQSPKECFPLSLFYESDSRDNLEENMTKPTNRLNQFVQSTSAEDYKFFLSADEMFVEAILDGSGKLDPKSNAGWNIYSETVAASKDHVAASGFRTDLKAAFDRKHPDNILSGIQIKDTVYCLLHCCARCVEKLLFLEVDRICSSEKNKTKEANSGIEGEDRIRNLEASINKRGVRNGQFRFHFDEKSHRPAPVSLNKDAAFSIISPPPQDKEERMPFVMTNVLGTRMINITLPNHVRTFLKLPAQIPELEFVRLMWESMYVMLDTLMSEPALPHECLRDGALEGSPQPEDYRWGYSDLQKEAYKFHAERFYQLFKLRFTHERLTPYMMKLVDYGLYFMESLPVPLCRFQAEGSEHLNYEHNRFYYGHTTRHGGNTRCEPLKALFLHMWRRICYDVHFKDSSNKEVASAFDQFVFHHCAATTIQKYARGWLVRKKLPERGFLQEPQTPEDRLTNYQAIASLLPDSVVSEGQPSMSQKPLSGCIFVFVGSVPKFQNRKITQRELYDIVHKLGGRTKKNLPGNVKGRSSKKYIVLYQPTGKSVPAAIRRGLSQGHHVVSYDFLFDTMVRRISVDIKKYVLPLVSLRSRLTLAIPVHKRHFRREITMTSLIKCAKRLRAKKMIRQKPGIPKHLTLAQFYAFRKRKALMKTKTLSLRECGKALGQYMSEWKNLEEIEKCLTQIEYVTYCRNRTELLKRYGSLNKPSYLTVLRGMQSVRV